MFMPNDFKILSNSDRYLVLETPYAGILSKNSYKTSGPSGYRTHSTKDEVRIWMDRVRNLVRQSSLYMFIDRHEDGLVRPILRIYLEGFFKDLSSTPDIHNLHEVVADSLKTVLIDDKFFLFSDLEWELGYSSSKLVIRIEYI